MFSNLKCYEFFWTSDQLCHKNQEKKFKQKSDIKLCKSLPKLELPGISMPPSPKHFFSTSNTKNSQRTLGVYSKSMRWHFLSFGWFQRSLKDEKIFHPKKLGGVTWTHLQRVLLNFYFLWFFFYFLTSKNIHGSFCSVILATCKLFLLI